MRNAVVSVDLASSFVETDFSLGFIRKEIRIVFAIMFARWFYLVAQAGAKYELAWEF